MRRKSLQYHGMVRYHAATQIRERFYAALGAEAGAAEAGAAGGVLARDALGWALRQQGLAGGVVVGLTAARHAETALEVARACKTMGGGLLTLAR